jgi:hypothetical protein
MHKKSSSAILGIICSLFLCLSLASAADFEKNYTLPPNSIIRIGNISGDVKVNGYGGSTVLVVAFKEGRDRDRVQIEDNSTSDRIDIRTRYPESGSCNASVNFEIKVPQTIEYNFDRLSSVSGNVEVADIRGRIRAESVSGNVDVRNISGIVSASAVSGDINVEIAQIQGLGDMKFSSVSGNVTVRAPANLEADIEMSSVSGGLKTDFPIEIQERRYGPGRSAHGRLGASIGSSTTGTRSMRITTVSGRVTLART